MSALRDEGVQTETIRLVDHQIDPGVVSEAVSDGDEWPAIRERILAAEILVVATPTWIGQPSSISKRALERMDAFLSETRDDDVTPIAYNRVAGVVVVGNEDDAHHCISEISGARRHRLHDPRAGLDVLEQRTGTRRRGVADHRRTRVVDHHRPDRRAQPPRGRARPDVQADDLQRDHGPVMHENLSPPGKTPVGEGRASARVVDDVSLSAAGVLAAPTTAGCIPKLGAAMAQTPHETPHLRSMVSPATRARYHSQAQISQRPC
jgi:hypothetical protein